MKRSSLVVKALVALMIVIPLFMSVAPMFAVQGQQIPREDTVFMIGVEWGTIRGMNPTPVTQHLYGATHTYHSSHTQR